MINGEGQGNWYPYNENGIYILNAKPNNTFRNQKKSKSWYIRNAQKGKQVHINCVSKLPYE